MATYQKSGAHHLSSLARYTILESHMMICMELVIRLSKKKVHTFKLIESNVFTAYTAPLVFVAYLFHACPHVGSLSKESKNEKPLLPTHFFAAFLLGPMYNWPTLWPLVLTGL